MPPNAGCKFGCSADANCAKWNPEAVVDRLLNIIKDETDVRKIAEIADKCLHLMSLNDACEFMTKHQYPINAENILKFKDIADRSYVIRLEIMKNLILE